MVLLFGCGRHGQQRYCLLVAALVAVTVWPHGLLVAEAVAPSINLVSSPALGVFMVARGKLLAQDDAAFTITVNNVCECKYACWTDNYCVAAGTTPSTSGDGSLDCRLAVKGPTESTLTDVREATYIFWKYSIPRLSYDLRKDGMMYLLVDKRVNFTSAKTLCSSIPGHRLAITKSKDQILTLLEIHAELRKVGMWADLSRPTIRSDIEWGDGTLFKDSPAFSYVQTNSNQDDGFVYRISNDVFQDITFAFESYPFCQANPLGKEW